MILYSDGEFSDVINVSHQITKENFEYKLPRLIYELEGILDEGKLNCLQIIKNFTLSSSYDDNGNTAIDVEFSCLKLHNQ